MSVLPTALLLFIFAMMHISFHIVKVDSDKKIYKWFTVCFNIGLGVKRKRIEKIFFFFKGEHAFALQKLPVSEGPIY